MNQPRGSDDFKKLKFAEATADREARAKLIAKTQRENRGRAIAKTILGTLLAVTVAAVWILLFGGWADE